jgi:hypothetical protein
MLAKLLPKLHSFFKDNKPGILRSCLLVFSTANIHYVLHKTRFFQGK